jgi:hypothetical protein
MSNHAGPQNIDNAFHLLSVSFNSIRPDYLSFPEQRLDERNVIYSWTDDDKEEFELEHVRLKIQLDFKETGLTVTGR